MEDLKNTPEPIEAEIGARPESEDLASLLKANLEMTKDIQVMVQRINRYVAWQRLFSWLRILLILIPLIIGALYLPPLFRDIINQYNSLIGGSLN